MPSYFVVLLFVLFLSCLHFLPQLYTMLKEKQNHDLKKSATDHEWLQDEL